MESNEESKIQDRINLFSNEGADAKSLGVPLTRMRNRSTPTKLPSQATYGVHTCTSSRVLQPKHSTGPQAEKPSTEVTAVMAAATVASDVLLETVPEHQWSKLQAQELATQAPGQRKSSGISAKIQHFEAFASDRALSIGSVVVDKYRKWSSPQSKRIQTWPIPASENVFNHKTEQAEVPMNSVEKQHIRQEAEKFTSSTASNSTETEKDKVIKRHQGRERARQKIQTRQERLNRRSRSRYRSAQRVSVPSNELEVQRQVFKHKYEVFGARDPRRRRSATGEAWRGVEMEIEIPLDTDSHTQHHRPETVQEIWIGGSEDGPSNEVLVVDTVVAQCELAEPRPMRLAETLRMVRLCRGRFGERSGTWRRKVGRSSEKGGGLAA